MTRSSLIVEKAATGLGGAARMGVSAVMRSPTQPQRPKRAFTACGALVFTTYANEKLIAEHLT